MTIDSAITARIQTLVETIAVQGEEMLDHQQNDESWVQQCRELLAGAQAAAARLGSGEGGTYKDKQTLATLARGLGECGLPVKADSSLDVALANLQAESSKLLLA